MLENQALEKGGAKRAKIQANPTETRL